jgi:hypothetical protein
MNRQPSLILLRSFILEIAWPLALGISNMVLMKSRQLLKKENRMAMIE